MRYESALQVIGFLKRSYGAPAPILRICQNISLSYQPTHKHVRALEELGVIETAKVGREVLCRLSASEETHVWLALLALAERGKIIERGGALGETATMLRGALSHAPFEGLEAVAVRGLGDDGVHVVLLATESTKDALVRRFKSRCRSISGDITVEGFTRASLPERLADPEERRTWIAEACPLHGEQTFWRAMLSAGAEAEGPIASSRGRKASR